MANNGGAASELKSISDWSEPLHLAFLSQPFVPRPLAGENKTEGAETGSLLIKLLPHTPSLTLGVLVLPLSTVAPLYEGLSLRTLQRRIKRSGPSQAGEAASQATKGQDSALFGELVESVEGALQGEDGAQRWLDCDIGRGEASLTLHHSSASGDFSVSFDLSSLDREDGPKVVRDHLLLPLTSMASSEETAASDVLIHLLTGRQSATRLMNAGERLAGRPSTTLDRDRVPSPQIEVTQPSPPLQSVQQQRRTRSPTLSKSRSPEETRSMAAPSHTPSKSSMTPRTPSSSIKQAVPQTIVRPSTGDDDDEEDIVIFNPTPTSSSHRYRQSNGQREKDEQRRLDAQSPTPGSRQSAGGQQLSPGVSTERKGSGKRSQGDTSKGDDDEDDEEEELSLGSKAAKGTKQASGQQRQASEAGSGQGDTTVRPADAEQPSRQPASDSRERWSPLPPPPPASTFESMPPTPVQVDPTNQDIPKASAAPAAPLQPPPTSSLTHGEVVEGPAGGGTGGRGTSRYTRGLAKRKRI